MTLYDIAQQLEFTHLTPDLQLDRTREITSGHVSDLLSDVIANAPGGGVLVTIQVHMNVIAVALHADVAAVIFAGGMEPDEAVRNRAIQEEIPLFSSKKSSFDVVGQLYAAGLRGFQA
jgi:predicted transcriptional regulator